jgi:hypothetical protein
MPAGAGIEKTELMVREGCRITAKSTTKSSVQNDAARSVARRLRHYTIFP